MPESSVQVSIQGMTCGSCSYKVECEVGDLPGVVNAKVDLAAKLGTFTYDSSSETGPTQIVDKINSLGFKAQLVCFNN